MKSYKIFCKRIIGIVLVALTVTMAANYVMDPFQIYHNSFFNRGHYLSGQERYQNAGLIREYWRDERCCTSIMIGTSMSQNFDGEKTGKILNTGTILNLSMAGARPAEEYAILQHVAQVRTPNTVFWELHTSFNVEEKPENTLVAGSPKFFPPWLYDGNIFNDYPYFLSASNFSYFVQQLVSKETLYGHKEWYKEHEYSFGKGRDVYKTGPTLHLKNIDMKEGQDLTFYAIPEYILPAVAKYKDTQFIFYFPPYSLHSHAAADEKAFLRVLTFRKKLVAVLSIYPNASVYMFDDLISETADLEKYKDLSHYDLDIGDKALGLIANKKGLLTEENIYARLNALLERSNAYCHSHASDCTKN